MLMILMMLMILHMISYHFNLYPGGHIKKQNLKNANIKKVSAEILGTTQ